MSTRGQYYDQKFALLSFQAQGVFVFGFGMFFNPEVLPNSRRVKVSFT